VDDEENHEECEGSQSAAVSRKLKELLKSGQFVVDGRKREVFEGKCKQMDNGVKFRYGEKWKVLHQKCGKWYTMTKPYSTTSSKHILTTAGPRTQKVVTLAFLTSCTPGRFSKYGRSGKKHKATNCEGTEAGYYWQSFYQVGSGDPPIITGSLPCLGLRVDHDAWCRFLDSLVAKRSEGKLPGLLDNKQADQILSQEGLNT